MRQGLISSLAFAILIAEVEAAAAINIEGLFGHSVRLNVSTTCTSQKPNPKIEGAVGQRSPHPVRFLATAISRRL